LVVGLGLFRKRGLCVKRIRRIKRLKQSGKLRRRKQSRERRVKAALAAILNQSRTPGMAVPVGRSAKEQLRGMR
jgi:hypothetical protein